MIVREDEEKREEQRRSRNKNTGEKKEKKDLRSLWIISLKSTTLLIMIRLATHGTHWGICYFYCQRSTITTLI